MDHRLPATSLVSRLPAFFVPYFNRIEHHHLVFPALPGNGFSTSKSATWWEHLKIGNDRMPIEQIDLILEKEGPQSSGSLQQRQMVLYLKKSFMSNELI